MGDMPPGTSGGPTRQHRDGSTDDEPRTMSRNFSNIPAPSPMSSRPSSAGPPFFSQYPNIGAPQQRMDAQGRSYQGGNTYSRDNPPQLGTNFNMAALGAALPDFQPHSAQANSPRMSGASAPAVAYQMPQTLQFSQQGAPTYPASLGGYGIGHVAGYHQIQHGHPHHLQYHGQIQMGAVQNPYAPYQQMSSQHYYHSGPLGGQGLQSGAFAYHAGQFQPLYPSRTGSEGSSTLTPGYGVHGVAFDPSQVRPTDSHNYQRPSEGISSAMPRGPPRKPKQSGHALWVGNLPPGATVIDLKDHFSRDATRDIESVFLISKSNCAFVNYRTEATCAAAMQRFHDSRFHGVRLVCRLRRRSAAISGTPTAPSSMIDRSFSATPLSKSPLLDTKEDAVEVDEVADEDASRNEAVTSAKSPEKYFIVKSLTLQDLEQSVLNGIWATQAHNEEALNKAFKATDNVYLVFSANKSGEYFGYARMASAIDADSAKMYRTIVQPEPEVQSSDTPQTIPTPATEFAPKGRIIDDSARGTIFWEAERSEVSEEEEDAKPDEEGGEDGVSQEWGKPFKIEWISTNRLPFYRTRGLRNPWNANREVKIARDGTELETGVGKRLVQMFHRPGPTSAPQAAAIPFGQMPAS